MNQLSPGLYELISNWKRRVEELNEEGRYENINTPSSSKRKQLAELVQIYNRKVNSINENHPLIMKLQKHLEDIRKDPQSYTALGKWFKVRDQLFKLVD